jgi:hypothetical protein
MNKGDNSLNKHSNVIHSNNTAKTKTNVILGTTNKYECKEPKQQHHGNTQLHYLNYQLQCHEQKQQQCNSINNVKNNNNNVVASETIEYSTICEQLVLPQYVHMQIVSSQKY